jgi:uncharacterized BrkB/YihY/UPF0761 family membrane protein
MLASLLASYAGAIALGDARSEIAVGLVLAVAAGFVATVATVAVIYKVFPRRPPDSRSTLSGALVAAAGISLLSTAYVTYLRFGANFERRYASDGLAAVVLLGLWLYAANAALLVGYRAARQRSPEGSCAAARLPEQAG